MTTPNGDNVKNTNPDHIRHYTKKINRMEFPRRNLFTLIFLYNLSHLSRQV